MAVAAPKPITSFEDWYKDRREDPNTGALRAGLALTEQATEIKRRYEQYKSEMDKRLTGYENLELLADGEVISPKPDLANVSSGETAGLVRRVARNLVQHTPNVEIKSIFDDDKPAGVFAKHTLLTKIIGDDSYSNDMQQNLFASTKSAFTLGFDCVIPVLLQDAKGSWYMKYDSIHYRDVFPEIGAKDIRQAGEVFIRRYLSKNELKALVRNNVAGWDIAAIKLLLQSSPQNIAMESNARQNEKHHTRPEGYEIITQYTDTGDPFLTFAAGSGILLRRELNKHPLKQHPVHFLVLEKDDQQPLGKSQVELLIGRQEFQDLMLNGAMKLWYRNINPTIIGYGADGAVPNLSPGQYMNLRNPKARLEPLDVNTGTLMQYGLIAEQNTGAMVNLIGSADQQMASQAGNGMSSTPQGVEAQQQMVDITTNNYQKAIESFFSHYCSYALTVYFAELQGSSSATIMVTADTRAQLLGAGMPEDRIDKDGRVSVDFKRLATTYNVTCIPGSLVELEDDKQIRILNNLFVALSQSMGALAATNNPEMVANAASALSYIIAKNIEMSGSSSSETLKQIFTTGVTPQLSEYTERIDAMETNYNELGGTLAKGVETMAGMVVQMQERMNVQQEALEAILEKMGGQNPQSTSTKPAPIAATTGAPATPATVGAVRA